MNEFLRPYRLLVLSFGVVVFLMNPFMGYALAQSVKPTGRIPATVQPLQRLVKKKDEHLETVAIISEPSIRKFNLKLSYRRLSALFLNVSRLLESLTYGVKKAIRLSEISPDNHRFRRYVVYRI